MLCAVLFPEDDGSDAAAVTVVAAADCTAPFAALVAERPSLTIASLFPQPLQFLRYLRKDQNRESLQFAYYDEIEAGG
eukprot:IDg23694t1